MYRLSFVSYAIASRKISTGYMLFDCQGAVFPSALSYEIIDTLTNVRFFPAVLTLNHLTRLVLPASLFANVLRMH